MSASPIAIPYEKQSETLTGRACGAACLSMVYKSFGMTVPQDEIWPVIAKANRFGQISSTTYLMTQDAVNRGFRAVALQARHPLQALRLAKGAGVRALLNHRVRRDSAAGHYSVLVDIDSTHVILHDPLFGAARKVPHAELVELWLPEVPNSEIVGGVLIAIAPVEPATAAVACEYCRTPMLTVVDCPRCKKPVHLEPSVVLGCVKDGCIARMWNWVCCPACDYVFTVKDGAVGSADVGQQAVGASGISAALPVVDVGKLFAEIDKFTAHIATIPGAAEHEDVKKQLDAIATQKQRFQVLQAAETAKRAAALSQLTAIAEKNKRDTEAAHKQHAEASKAPPPLDGNALGAELLKNLGFK